jgi:hypothetical protein
MFNQNTTADTKIAVLEERLSSYELMMKKIDEAIQIMGKTSQNISKMLAVHEEKIEQCGKADDLLTKMIYEMKEESEEHCSKVSERINKIEDDIKEIVKFRWMVAGSGIVVAIIITTVTTLASGWWDPMQNEIRHQPHQQQLMK